MTTLAQNRDLDPVSLIPTRIKVYVFIFCFLALMIDAADMMFLSYSLNSLEAEFGLTQTQKGSLGTFTLLGMFFGGVAGGWACDRFGRVKTIVVCIVIFSVGTAALGFTHSYLQFAVIRFLSAIGIGAIYLSCSILMSEYVTKKHRSTIMAMLIISWSIGYIVASLLAKWIIPEWGWRYLFFTAIIPVFLSVIMFFLVPEPPSWIANRKAKVDKQASDAADVAQGKAVIKSDSALKTIVDTKGVLLVFISWMFVNTFFQFSYYGVMNWMPSYLERELGVNFKAMTSFMIGTFIAMMLGKVLGGFLADKLGRRAVYAVGSLGTAIFIPLLVLYNTEGNIVWLMCGFGLLFGIPISVMGTYMTESFPGKVRGFAMGWAYNAGRIGGVLAPITIGFLADHYSFKVGFLGVGIALCLMGLVPAILIKSGLYDPSKE